MNLNFNFNGLTRLKNWWGIVKANFETIQSEHNGLKADVETEKEKLSTEITQRTNADVALSNRINAEANTRSSTDTALGTRIDAETTARQTADVTLGNRITAETNSRSDADEILKQRIDSGDRRITTLEDGAVTETSMREEADKLLNERIDILSVPEGQHNRCFGIKQYTDEGKYSYTAPDGEEYLVREIDWVTGDEIYKSDYVTIDKFASKIAYPSEIEIRLEMGDFHFKASNCDSGGMQTGESGLLINFTDGTRIHTTFDKANRTKTSSVDASGLSFVGGMCDIYEYMWHMTIDKEIASIVFSPTADNFFDYYSNDEGMCTEIFIYKNVAVYDSNSAAIMDNIWNLSGKLATETDERKIAEKSLKKEIDELAMTIEGINTTIGNLSGTLNEVNGVVL